MAAPEIVNDKYEVLRPLGQGASGVVHVVRDLEDGIDYVMKRIDMSKFERKDVEHAMTEVLVLSNMHHPNVVSHKESWVDGQFLFLVMEYADGGELENRIKDQRKTGHYFTENQILDWFTQICLALKHCHDRKVIHRDLKTQNIFLTADGRVKLGDFGLTTVLANTLANADTRLGTPYFLSPELCEGKPYNAKNDIWALGAVLYKICSLRHAFPAKTMKSLISAVINKPTPKLSRGYSSKLQRIVDALLQKDPENRPTINELLRYSVIRKRIPKFLTTEEYEAEFSHDTLHGFVIGESADPNVMTNNATLDDGSDSDSNRDSQCSDEVFEISRSFSGSASEDDEARQEVPMWCWVNWFALAKGAPLRVGC